MFGLGVKVEKTEGRGLFHIFFPPIFPSVLAPIDWWFEGSDSHFFFHICLLTTNWHCPITVIWTSAMVMAAWPVYQRKQNKTDSMKLLYSETRPVCGAWSMGLVQKSSATQNIPQEPACGMHACCTKILAHFAKYCPISLAKSTPQ